jgi:hypothetical protein
MDNFLDVIIVRKKKGLYSLLYFLASLLMIVLGLIAAIFLFQVLRQDPETGAASFNLMALIVFVITGGGAFLLYWRRAFIKIDYDISFTNGFVEIARVANNVRRKELCRFYMKEVEAGGYASDPNFKRYDSMKNVKRYKAVLNKDEEVFWLLVRVGDTTALVTFEANNEELIKLMHQYNPRNIKIKK